MRTLTSLIFLLLLLAVLPGATLLAQDDTGTDTITGITAADDRFSTLASALEAAGLTETLSGPGPFTIFAPTNSAFESMAEISGTSLDALLADTETLTQILQYHVVDGELTASDLESNEEAGVASATTLAGSDIMVTAGDDGIFLNGNPLLDDAGTEVTETDIMASNGVIHVIDSVLIPPATPVTTTKVATAYIRFAHFSPNGPPVDIYFNGALSDIASISYPHVTGWIEVEADTYEIALAPFESSVEDAVLGPVALSFAPGSRSTLAMVGVFGEDSLALNLGFEDINTALADDEARVSVYHAIPDAPAVDVLVNGEALISGLAFPGTQGDNDGLFVVDVPAGTHDIQIVPAGDPDSVLIDLPATQIEAGTFYVIAAVGWLGEPDVLVESLTRAQVMGEAPVATATPMPDMLTTTPAAEDEAATTATPQATMTGEAQATEVEATPTSTGG